MTKAQEIVFMSGHAEPLPEAGNTDRRFFAVDAVKLINAQQHANHLHAHADHLTSYQRASGVRVRLCTSGCYTMYNAEGNFIGRTPPPGTLTGLPSAALKTAAARMAYSEELASVCRLADIDFERTGTVAPGTVAAIRKLLGAIGAA